MVPPTPNLAPTLGTGFQIPIRFRIRCQLETGQGGGSDDRRVGVENGRVRSYTSTDLCLPQPPRGPGLVAMAPW